MIITYTPQLENPPRDKEVTLGFSIIGEKAGVTKRIHLKSGVNRDVSVSDWEKIKEMPLVGELLTLGALQVQEDVEVRAPRRSRGSADEAATSDPLRGSR